MATTNNEKPVVVITGASSGIGRSTDLAWARNGYQVVINIVTVRK